jgi:hypothetical protein
MIALPTERTLTTDKGTIMDGNSRFHASKRLATTVAMLTIGFGLATPPSYGAGVWTNEPAGATVVLDCPFSGKPSACGILDAYSSSIQDSDGTAPVSAAGVAKSTIYAGNNYGGMQLNWVAPQVSNEMYVGMMWRTNPQFYGRTVANKMFFIRGPQVNGFWGMNGCPGQGSPTCYLMFGHNTATLNNSQACSADLGLICNPNVGPGTITLGTWTKLEAYVKKSTTATSQDGIVRWWINGVMAGNYTNMNYAPNGLNEWVWSETWDGYVNPVPSVDWSHFIDHLHISIPGGSNSADQPPGPPAAPTLRSVTTP